VLRSFPRELEEHRRAIEARAREEGLDFYDTIFEMVDFDQMNQIAAYGGFPTRYPHWRFGMDYERLRKQHSYGLSRIYEMVINNDPCYAYLLTDNALVDQKTVMAHVYAHCDFFKNNRWFAHTNRKMMDEMANHATRVWRHIERRRGPAARQGLRDGREVSGHLPEPGEPDRPVLTLHASPALGRGAPGGPRYPRAPAGRGGGGTLPGQALHGPLYQPARAAHSRA